MLTNGQVVKLQEEVYGIPEGYTFIEKALDRATGTREILTSVPLVPIGFGVRPELYDRMKANATECGTSLSQLCRAAVEDFLNRLDDETLEGSR